MVDGGDHGPPLCHMAIGVVAIACAELFLGNNAEDFGGVALGSNEGPDFLDFSGFADEERAADASYSP